MAQAELSPGIDRLRGKLAGYSGMQARMKEWKDDDGKVVKVGPQEMFKRRSRDYKRSPRTEAEEAQARIWQTVCRAASEIIHDQNHPRYAELRQRWNAQFKGSGDPYLNDEAGKTKIYGMFPVFVRMVLMKELKEQTGE